MKGYYYNIIMYCVIMSEDLINWHLKGLQVEFLEDYVSGIFLYSGISDATVN